MTRNEILLGQVGEQCSRIINRVEIAARDGLGHDGHSHFGEAAVKADAEMIRHEYVGLQAAIMMCVRAGLLPDCSATLPEIIAKKEEIEKYIAANQIEVG